MANDLKKQWQASLEQKQKKIKKKDIERVMDKYIKYEGSEGSRYKIVAVTYSGQTREFINLTKEACLRDIATLNGFSME